MKIGELIDVLDLDTRVSVHASREADWASDENPYFMPKVCREITWHEYKTLEGKKISLIKTLTSYGSEPTFDYLDVTYD